MIDNMSYYVMLNNSVRIFNIEINSCPASSQCIGGRLIIIFTLILTNTQQSSQYNTNHGPMAYGYFRLSQFVWALWVGL